MQLHWFAIALLGMLTASLACAAAAQEDYQANEYEIKAAYLLNFTNFVEWPGLSGANPSIHVCLLGSDPLSGSLSRMIDQRTSRDRPLLFRRIARKEGVSDARYSTSAHRRRNTSRSFSTRCTARAF